MLPLSVLVTKHLGILHYGLEIGNVLGMNCGLMGLLAVRERFELSKPYGLHTFQACSFGHSDTSPYSVFCTLYSDSKKAATLA